MLTKFQLGLLLFVLGAPTTVGTVLYVGWVSSDNWIYNGGNVGKVGSYNDGGLHGAPGPIAGVGLPGLVIGGGAYWLIRRRRRKPD